MPTYGVRLKQIIAWAQQRASPCAVSPDWVHWWPTLKQQWPTWICFILSSVRSSYLSVISSAFLFLSSPLPDPVPDPVGRNVRQRCPAAGSRRHRRMRFTMTRRQTWHFDSILQSNDLLMVFSGYDDLSMLWDQFSIEFDPGITCHLVLNITIYSVIKQPSHLISILNILRRAVVLDNIVLYLFLFMYT